MDRNAEFLQRVANQAMGILEKLNIPRDSTQATDKDRAKVQIIMEVLDTIAYAIMNSDLSPSDINPILRAIGELNIEVYNDSMTEVLKRMKMTREN